MMEKMRRAIARHGLTQPGEHALIGVSGGADSVALLAALRERAPVLKVRLTVAHLNHGLRGRAAAEDAAFVRDLAAQWGLPCVIGQARVRTRAKNKGISIEMAARETRYAFLERVARRVRADVVVTAHTADDQAETVLLKLARGAGPDGLGGMRAVRTLPSGTRHVRPMLETSRREIEAYLKKNGIPWREDASNLDADPLRNRVRHDVLPMLESVLNPQIRAALTRTADICRADTAWLDAQALTLLRQCQETGDGFQGSGFGFQERGDRGQGAGDRVQVSGFRKEGAGDGFCDVPGSLRFDPLLDAPLAARRRVLRLWLTENGVPAEHLDFEAVDRIDRLLRRRQGGGQVPVGQGRIVRRHERRLDVLMRPESAATCAQAGSRADASLKARMPGTTCWPEYGLRVTVRRAQRAVKERETGLGRWPACASLSMKKTAGRALRVRFWRPGDRMRPWGLNGSKKLQDIFADAKVPPEQRQALPVFECDGEIVWLPGYRIAQGWAVEENETACWRLRVEAVLTMETRRTQRGRAATKKNV